jgi:hypothetical protein
MPEIKVELNLRPEIRIELKLWSKRKQRTKG